MWLRDEKVKILKKIIIVPILKQNKDPIYWLAVYALYHRYPQ